MTSNTPHELDELPAEDFEIFRGAAEPQPVRPSLRKTHFAPWHHPVKQVIRKLQWAALTEEFINTASTKMNVLQYFTLPGPDLLDIRVLSEVCAPRGVEIEYFGFNKSINNSDAVAWNTHVTAESSLRQSGRITSNTLVLPYALEEIARSNSHAQSQLRQRGHFDIINIDACDHLAFSKGTGPNTFDAMKSLLGHQLTSKKPWLLFLTTRADKKLLGADHVSFQQAISSNLQIPGSPFTQEICDCFDIKQSHISSGLNGIWSEQNLDFLKLYAIGLGKHLLQWFAAQPNHPTDVELASAYAYRVYADEPDMLALAFRITPDEIKIHDPCSPATINARTIEPKRAAYIVKRAAKMSDADELISLDEGIRNRAIEETRKLLLSADYDEAEWENWLKTHRKRPIDLSGSRSHIMSFEAKTTDQLPS